MQENLALGACDFLRLLANSTISQNGTILTLKFFLSSNYSKNAEKNSKVFPNVQNLIFFPHSGKGDKVAVEYI